MSKIEIAAALHQRQSRITFKVLKETDAEIIVRVAQGKNPQSVYQTASQLSEIAQELYAESGKRVLSQPLPYIPPPADVVTPAWIQQQMLQHGIHSKQLIQALGLTKEDLSGLMNGHKEMGIRTKGLFFYYFKSVKS
jgi:hypothetical protein